MIRSLRPAVALVPLLLGAALVPPLLGAALVPPLLGAALAPLLLLGAAPVGCAGGPAAGGLACPVALVPSKEIEPAARQRYRIAIESGDAARRVEAVSFREGDAWLLVGFTPFNTRLFTLRQEGLATTVQDGSLARRFGVDPVHVQDALHRAFFVRSPGEDGEPPEVAAGDAITWVRAGERIRDVNRAGRLASRSVVPASADADRPARRQRNGRPARNAARISIEYHEPPAGAAASWTIDNPSCGYTATVVVLASPGAQSASSGGPSDTSPSPLSQE